MSYKKDELLNYLNAALEQIESSVKRVYGFRIETLDLSPALVSIEKARNIASPRDKALVEEFESEIKKFVGVRMTAENIAEVKEILRHFGSEVSMAKVVQDYSEDEYNSFLKLLEDPKTKDCIISLQEEKAKPISREELKIILDLKIVEDRNGKIHLTERGKCLAKVLRCL